MCLCSVWEVTLRGVIWLTGVAPPRTYRNNKVASCVFPASRKPSQVAFHHDQDNLMQDSETVENLQVIKPQWFTVGTALQFAL